MGRSNSEKQRQRYATDPAYRTERKAAAREYARTNAIAISKRRRAQYAENAEEERAKARARRAADPSRQRAADRNYVRRNPDRVKAKIRRQNLRAYGLTEQTFAALFSSQNGQCAICELAIPMDGVGRHIDHDHTTGALRGILCRLCNVMIGFAREDCGILGRAIAYLERSSK